MWGYRQAVRISFGKVLIQASLCMTHKLYFSISRWFIKWVMQHQMWNKSTITHTGRSHYGLFHCHILTITWTDCGQQDKLKQKIPFHYQQSEPKAPVHMHKKGAALFWKWGNILGGIRDLCRLQVGVTSSTYSNINTINSLWLPPLQPTSDEWQVLLTYNVRVQSTHGSRIQLLQRGFT